MTISVNMFWNNKRVFIYIYIHLHCINFTFLGKFYLPNPAFPQTRDYHVFVISKWIFLKADFQLYQLNQTMNLFNLFFSAPGVFGYIAPFPGPYSHILQGTISM